MPTQVTTNSFTISGYGCAREADDFDVTVETGLTLEELYKLLLREYVPIAGERIEKTATGFVLHYPQTSSRLAGDFFAALFAGQLSGKADPKQYALAQIAARNLPNRIALEMAWLLEQRIGEYYERIDAQDVDWVIALFDVDGIYRRAEAEYVGRERIAEFYRSERKISGTHQIESILVHGLTVVVRGVFTGVGAVGQSKQIRFSDIWTFNLKGLVELRETYLAQGADYVRE